MRSSKKIQIGNIAIGGGEKIAVQSMSTLKISDTKNATAQALDLKREGCDILRFSVLDEKDALSFKEIKRRVEMPLVADIHFDYRLAIKSIEGGADKIRINPGNIGGEDKIKEVAAALKGAKIPVRVGANTGSIEKELLAKYGKDERALGESALKNARWLEKYGVENIVISVKASSVPLAIKAYRYVAERCDYPLHLGVTEAGREYNGVIKNAIAMGSLLFDGIGDTIRVSLSADPIREVVAANAILSALDLKKRGAEVIACPTCGRCEWNCMGFAERVEKYLANINTPLKVAVMGCVVNGPGEAADADIGVAGGKGECVIFKGGKIIKKVKESELERVFFEELEEIIKKDKKEN